MIEVGAAVAAIAAVPAAGELGARRLGLGGEPARKLVHAGSGVVAAGLPLLLTYREIAAIALAFAVLMLVARRLRLLTALTGVERASLGEVWFPVGVAALAICFPHDRPYVYGTLVLGLADALAALVGERIGRRRLPLVDGKTVWGSAAFCGTALLVGVAVADSLSLGVVVAGVVLTAAEAVTSRGADNVVVPLTAGLLATYAWA